MAMAKGLSFRSCGCEVGATETHTGFMPSRRKFLAGAAAAAGAGLSLPAWAQNAAPASSPLSAGKRIDVHHHFSPPNYIPELVKRNTNQKPLEEWTAQKSLDVMGKAGIQTAMVSISEPGVWFGDNKEGLRIARETNEWGAKLVTDHPGRFGLFASLPIPDIDGSLKEIEYAFDTLKADGICMMTSYAGTYLGDKSLEPIMAELNRRKAVIFTHPVKADCCKALVPDVGPNTIELGTDTARTITSILVSGTVVRYPDIRFIFSHAGGSAPALTGRLISQISSSPATKKMMPDGPIPYLQKLYYDTANAANPYALAPLMKLVSNSQILFGSDFPLRSPEENAQGLIDLKLFNDSELNAINRGNAELLIPRLKI
jgi:predicted TIM-barrel fold metal-dependent hydrolase